jgi:hypothetical protein
MILKSEMIRSLMDRSCAAAAVCLLRQPAPETYQRRPAGPNRPDLSLILTRPRFAWEGSPELAFPTIEFPLNGSTTEYLV